MKSETTGTKLNSVSQALLSGASLLSLAVAGLVFSAGVTSPAFAQDKGQRLLPQTRAAGDNTVTINAGQALNAANAAFGDGNNGYDVNATAATGSATLIHNGTGTISAVGGDAISVMPSPGAAWGAATGSAKVTLGSDVILNVNNSNPLSYDNPNWLHAGLNVKAAESSGTIDITSAATITAYGTRGLGIHAIGGSGAMTIANTGKITTNGYYADAIYAQSMHGANVAITNSAALRINGHVARGIAAESTTGQINITNTGRIETSAGPGSYDGYGIYGYSTGAGANITINNSGYIQAGVAHGHGIFANAMGNATINNTGDILAWGGEWAGTMHALSVGGNATITHSGGTLTTNGYNAFPVLSSASMGLGNALVIVESGTIINNTTGGVSGHGIEAIAAGGGNATILLNGGTVTNAVNYGLVAWDGNNGAGGTITIKTGEGTSVTSGGNGIIGWGSTSRAGSEVSIESRSTVIAKGVGIGGATAGLGLVTVKQLGASITAGVVGLNAQGGKDVVVVNSGVIKTEGVDASHTIYAYSTGTGDVSVTNSNELLPQNVGSHGIYATSTSTGTVTVANSGKITIAAGDQTSGIKAVTENGAVSVSHTANTISIAADNAGPAALAQATGTGAASVTTGGTISVTGTNAASAALAKADGAGAASVTMTGGTISVTGATAASAAMAQAAGGGNASVTVSGGAISITGSAVGSAAKAQSAGAGSASVTVGGGTLTVDGANAASTTLALASGTGSANITMTAGTVSNKSVAGTTNHGLEARAVGGGDANITMNSGTVDVARGVGLYAWEAGTGLGNATVKTSVGSTIKTTSSAAILATAGSSTKGTSVLVDSQSIITSDTTGIQATSTKGGAVSVKQHGGTITTGVAGINAASTGGAVTIANDDKITVSGANAIHVIHGEGNSVAITTKGALTLTSAPTTAGVAAVVYAHALTGDATVTASNTITTNASHGIEAQAMAAGAKASVDFNNGEIKLANTADVGHGIVVGNQATTSTVKGEISVGATAKVDVLRGLGLQAGAGAGNAVKIADGALVNGGAAALQYTNANTTQTNTLDNSGIMEARQDVVVTALTTTAASKTTMTNTATGVMTGVILMGGGINALENAGLWDLRSFADTDMNATRETWKLAVSDFGAGTANSINNTGTLRLRGMEGTPTSYSAAGAYMPLGYTYNTPTQDGPVQGHIYGVNTFTQAGIIDMTNMRPETTLRAGGMVSDHRAGDVLVISGGHTAGTDGGGVFVSSKGTIFMDTVLNAGGAASQSDVVVVDSTRLLDNNPTNATRLVLTTTGSGSYTDGNGILLVEVLNKPQSAAGVFVLGSRAAAGAYEYLLFHGGVGADSADGNWYLRNTFDPPVVPPVVEPPVEPGPGNPPPVTPVTPPPVNPEPVPIIRVEVPVSMVIPPLALEYGYSMLGSLQDRVGESYHTSDPVMEDREVWCKDPSKNFKCVVRVPLAAKAGEDKTKWASSGWARLMGDRGEHEPDNFMRRGPNYDYTFAGIQAGLDVYAREQGDGTLDKVGVYIGYGQITSDVNGQLGTKAGTVDMDAYTAAGYWTHRSPTGWYTDAVIQGTWYEADARSVYGQGMKPNGFGLLGSLEAGYTFKLGNGFALEPQAQAVYQTVSFDNSHDQFGFVRFDDADSVRARVGLRLAKTWNRADEGQAPRLITGWVRANAWHEFLGKTTTSWGSLDGQNLTPFNSYLGGTWGELGAGVTAQMTDKVNLFASGAYNRSLDNKGRQGWDGRLGMSVKW